MRNVVEAYYLAKTKKKQQVYLRFVVVMQKIKKLLIHNQLLRNLIIKQKIL